jgi:hypothetical protein
VSETGPDPGRYGIEELDEAPRAPGKTARWGEVLIGLALLLIVAAVGGANWWQGETQHVAYRAGDRAATAQQWEDARDQLLAAGGYSDARARAAQAAAQIAERDRQYGLALAALAKDDGVAAVRALDALDKIEPEYGGTALLRSEAEALLYRSALEGMVALRRQASPPGLYYRTADDWVWLTGSDAASSLHNDGDSSYIVYDVPDAAGKSAARRLMAAHVEGGSLSFAPIALRPAARVFWGAVGGWSYASACRESIPPQSRSYYCVDGMIYSAADSTVTTPVKLPGPNWIVVDLAPAGSKMLVADVSTGPGGAAHAALYVAAADGSDPQLLYEGASWIERAAFSPDGRYVLATLASTGGAQETTYKAVLLDPAGDVGPQIIDMANYPNDDTAAGMDFVLLAGAGSGKVAVMQYGDGQILVKILDLTGAPQLVQPVASSLLSLAPLMVTRLDDGGLLLCGRVNNVSITLDSLNTYIGRCVLHDSAGQETTFDLPAITRYGIGYAWPRQGALFYPIAVPQGGSAGLSVLRITPTPPTGTGRAPAVILQLPLDAGQPLNLVAGPELLAYARQGQLHVRTYDGRFDLPLEQGIDVLYDVRGEANITMLF